MFALLFAFPFHCLYCLVSPIVAATLDSVLAHFDWVRIVMLSLVMFSSVIIFSSAVVRFCNCFQIKVNTKVLTKYIYYIILNIVLFSFTQFYILLFVKYFKYILGISTQGIVMLLQKKKK